MEVSNKLEGGKRLIVIVGLLRCYVVRIVAGKNAIRKIMMMKCDLQIFHLKSFSSLLRQTNIEGKFLNLDGQEQ